MLFSIIHWPTSNNPWTLRLETPISGCIGHDNYTPCNHVERCALRVKEASGYYHLTSSANEIKSRIWCPKSCLLDTSWTNKKKNTHTVFVGRGVLACLAPGSVMCNSCTWLGSTWICRVMFLIRMHFCRDQNELAKCPSHITSPMVSR